jgi:hypothetical protein
MDAGNGSQTLTTAERQHVIELGDDGTKEE